MAQVRTATVPLKTTTVVFRTATGRERLERAPSSPSHPRVSVIVAALLAFAAAIAGCDSRGGSPGTPGNTAGSSPQPGGDRPATAPAGRVWRIALLHPGRENDRGWNQLAFDALQQLDRRDDVTTRHALTPNRSNFKTDIRAFAEQDYDLVICHGGEFVKAAREVAKQYPRTRLVVTGSDEAGDGVATLDFRLWEATYLCGVLAASVAPDGPAGLIGGEDFRTVRYTLDAFALGARSVRSDYATYTQYVGSWDDVARAAQTARSLIDAYRVQVLFQNCDAAAFGVFQAATDAKVPAFGANSDQNSAAPDVVLASAVIDMTVAYQQLLDRLIAGTLVDQPISHDLRSGGIRLAINDGLAAKWPPGTRARLDAAREQIISGRLDVLKLVSAPPAKP